MMKSDAEVACAVIGPVLPDENIRCGGELLSGREWVELQVARSQQPGKQPWRVVERVAYPNGKGGGPQTVLYVLPVRLTKAQQKLADDRAAKRKAAKAAYRRKGVGVSLENQTGDGTAEGSKGVRLRDDASPGLASLGGAL